METANSLKIQLFAAARDLLGRSFLELEIELPCSVEALRKTLCEREPRLSAILSHSRIAVDQGYALESDSVFSGSEVAIIPPVSGG